MSVDKWLDAYEGQTTDELIALESGYRADSLVLVFEQALMTKAVCDGVGGLTEEERVVLAVEAVEREVNNGGFDQLFTDASKALAPYFVDSLDAIGAGEAARLTRQAIDALGIDGPVTVEAVDRAMERDSEARDDALAECDDRYYEHAGDLADPLFAYIKANRARITLGAWGRAVRSERRSMPSEKVRWGILGPGGIANRLLRDAGRAANFGVVAAGSRNLDRATEFAARFGIARAYGSYEQLLTDPEVDAVYVGVPNSLHHRMTMMALAAGKHVLCEKPYTRHPEQVVEAFDAADRAGLLLMEAFMWRHSPQTRRFMELLPEVGEVQAIRSTFSFELTATADVRLDSALDGGSLMDVGCYTISGSRLVAGAEPVRVLGEQALGQSGVDTRFSGLLRFPSGVVAELAVGFTSEARSLEVVGASGTLLSRDPWQGELGGIELNGVAVPVAADDAYRLEMENLSAAILGHGAPLLGRADALGQARTVEALYRSAESGLAISLK